MKLFNIFRKIKHEAGNKLADMLVPKVCETEIPAEIISAIDQTNWEDFESAYGNAGRTIPFYLKNLFCKDTVIALGATHQLWCSLCHQHAFISTAALPAYDILRIGLVQLEDKLKIEVLDIIEGFANCTSPAFGEVERQGWKMSLRQKLIADTAFYRQFSTHPDKLLSTFAIRIVDCLTKGSELSCVAKDHKRQQVL